MVESTMVAIALLGMASGAGMAGNPGGEWRAAVVDGPPSNLELVDAERRIGVYRSQSLNVKRWSGSRVRLGAVFPN
jgi:hypothetical protein